MSDASDSLEMNDADLNDSDLAAASLLLVDDNQQNLELMLAWLETYHKEGWRKMKL